MPKFTALRRQMFNASGRQDETSSVSSWSYAEVEPTVDDPWPEPAMEPVQEDSSQPAKSGQPHPLSLWLLKWFHHHLLQEVHRLAQQQHLFSKQHRASSTTRTRPLPLGDFVNVKSKQLEEGGVPIVGATWLQGTSGTTRSTRPCQIICRRLEPGKASAQF